MYVCVPVLTGTLGVHNPLWNSLPVKVGHFIGEDHILDQQRTPGPRSLQVEFVPHWVSCSRGQRVHFLLHKHRTHELVQAGDSAAWLVVVHC